MRKKKMTVGLRISLMFFIVLGASLLWLFLSGMLHRREPLPILGNPDHVTLPFTLTDQRGMTVTEAGVAGKIRVAGYFFATCKGICPIMNHHLQAVDSAFRDDSSVVILSHTVDPAHDSVAVLRDYAQGMGASPGKWYFFTGPKEELYKLASRSYLLNTDSIPDKPVDTTFFHSPNVTLVDRAGRIRGFYDATNRRQVQQLIKDIGQLR